MRLSRIFLLAAIISIVVTQACLAETTIKAEVDKLALSTDDTLTYKLIITSSEKKLPAPQMPDFKSFNQISQANSSTISFANKQIKSVLVYAFILQPNTVGKLVIGPAVIKVGDQSFSSQEFTVEVTKGKAEIPLPSGPNPVLPPDFPAQDEPQYTL